MSISLNAFKGQPFILIMPLNEYLYTLILELKATQGYEAIVILHEHLYYLLMHLKGTQSAL